jgi:serine/threonine protein phosphatase 1
MAQEAPQLQQQFVPRVPAGLRLYVIGDVHGRFDLLEDLNEKITSDLAGADYDEALTVFLGDYIDRGPDSAAVIARLAEGDFPTPIIALRGNHEQMLLSFLEDERLLDFWRRFGGVETLQSFDIDMSEVVPGTRFKTIQEELSARLTHDDLHFMADTRSYFSVGDYFFCHAGVRPGVALTEQHHHDLLWIRDDFLGSEADHGKIIVHGHTPVTIPDVRPNRINIDTGAFASDVLTCLVLQGEKQRFILT